MKDKLTIDNGALAGERVVNGRDKHGEIAITVSIFMQSRFAHSGKTAILWSGKNANGELLRFASLVLRRADAESWAGTKGTVSYELEAWAREILRVLAKEAKR